MIKVALGEAKTQEKPFPKLMKSDIGQIIIAIVENDIDDDCLIGWLVESNGYSAGDNGFSTNWVKKSFTDYNEPITIQNA